MKRILSILLLVALACGTAFGGAIPDRPSHIYEVKFYGAKGDTSTNDQDAIQDAINAANAVGGGVVHVPEGIYMHDSVIVIKAGVRLIGEGELRSTDTTTSNIALAIKLTGIGPELRGVRLTTTFAGARQTEADGSAIVVTAATDFVIEGVTIDSSGTAGMIITDSSTSGRVLNNVIKNTLADAIIHSGRCTDILIHGNRIENPGDDGIAVVSFVANGGSNNNITISNNSVQDGATRGITVVGGDDIIIHGNTITNAALSGIYVASEAGFDTYGANNITITGNTIDSSGSPSGTVMASVLFLGRALYPVENIVFANNIVSNCRFIGVQVGAGSAIEDSLTTNVKILGNSIEADLALDSGNAIYIAAATDVLVEGNSVTGFYGGGLVGLAAAGSGALVIRDNIFTDINTNASGSADCINLTSTTWDVVVATGNSYFAGDYAIERFFEALSFTGKVFLRDNYAPGETDGLVDSTIVFKMPSDPYSASGAYLALPYLRIGENVADSNVATVAYAAQGGFDSSWARVTATDSLVTPKVVGANRTVHVTGWKADKDPAPIAEMYFDTTVVTAGKTGAWIVTDTAGVPDTLNNLNRFLVASGTSDSIGYDTNGGAIDGYLYPTYLREGANVTFTIAGEDTLTIAASAGSGLDTTEVLQIITDNPISSAQIADSAITNADVSATAGIEGSKLADNSIDQEELANTLDFTGNVITFDAGEITYGEIAFSNNIVAGDIATQAVGALEIENNSIAQGDIATGGVASDEIADGTVDSVDLAKVYVAADGGTPLTADWAAGDHNITGLEKVEADTLQAASFILNVAGVDYYYDSTSAGGSGYTLTVDPTDSTIGWAEGGAGKVASISFDTTDNGTPDLITTDSLAIRAGAYIDFSWTNGSAERELTISSTDATTGDTTSANPFRVVINYARQMSLWEDSAFFDAAQIYKGVSHADSVLVTKGYAQSLSGSGEVNTLADTGTFNGTEGFGLAGGKTGVALKVKGLIAGSNITITADGDSAFSIASTGGGSGTTDTTFVNTTAGGGAPTDSIVNDPYLAQGQNINLTVAGDTVTIAAVDSVTHALIADSAKKVDTTGVVWNEATHAAVADSASKVDTTGVVWNEASHAAVADSSSKVDTTGIVWNEAAHAVLADSATAIADGAVSGSDKIAAHIIDTSDLNVLAVGADGKVLTTTSGQFSWADDANTQNPVTVYKDSFYVKHLSTMAGLGVDGFKYKGDTIFIDTADAGAGGGSEDSLTVNVSGVEYSIMSDYIKLKAGSGVTFTRADSTAFDDISFSVDTTALPLEKYAASADSATWNQAYDSVIAWADQPNQHLPLAGGRMTGYTGDFVIDSAKAGDTRSLTRLGFYDTAEVVHYIDYDAVDNRYEIDGPAIFNGDVVATAGKFTSAAGNSEQWELAYDSTLAWDNGVLLWASGIQALTADWAAGDFEVTGLNVVESDTFSVDPGGLATVLWEDGGGNLSFKDAVTGTKTLAELAAGGADGDSMILNAGTALTGTVHFVQGTGMTLVHGNGAGNDSITFNSTGGSPWSESEAAGDTTMRWVDGGSDTLITFDKTTSTNVKISTGDLDNAFTLHIEGEAGTTIGDTATDAAATVFMADTIRAEAANTLLIGTPNIPIKQINMNDFDLYTGGDNGGAYDSTDVPTNGQVLSWATGGIINWQDDDGAANSLANLFPFFHRDYFDTAADAGGDSIFVILSDSATNIEDGSVTGGTAGSGVKIAATTITDANINAGAAIAYSKLNHPDADHTSLQTTAIHNTDNDTSNANVRLHIRDTVGVSGMNLTAPVINTSIDLPANAVNTATEISADIITGTQIIDDLATGIDTITVTNLVEADTIYAEHIVANTQASIAGYSTTSAIETLIEDSLDEYSRPSIQFTFVNPNGLGSNDTLPVFHFDGRIFPAGVTITEVSYTAIGTPADTAILFYSSTAAFGTPVVVDSLFMTSTSGDGPGLDGTTPPADGYLWMHWPTDPGFTGRIGVQVFYTID